MSKKITNYRFITRAITLLQNDPPKPKKVPKWFKVLDIGLASIILCGFWGGVVYLIIKICHG